jgi:hypothetical protein
MLYLFRNLFFFYYFLNLIVLLLPLYYLGIALFRSLLHSLSGFSCSLSLFGEGSLFEDSSVIGNADFKGFPDGWN